MTRIQSPLLHLEPRDLAIVRDVPMFAHMDDAIVDAILSGAVPRRWERGAPVMLQGDPAEAFWVILDGWVKLARVLPDGSEAVVAVMTSGESFAEAVMFMGGRYPVSAETATEARLIRIEASTLRAAMRADGRVSIALLASIAHHGAALAEQVHQLKALSAPRRVADFLVTITRRQAGPGAVGRQSLTLPFDKGLIARRLGMTPESFSRALAVLRDEGVVVERTGVEIASVARLTRFAREAGDDWGG